VVLRRRPAEDWQRPDDSAAGVRERGRRGGERREERRERRDIALVSFVLI
jgi:hypothetical protein